LNDFEIFSFQQRVAIARTLLKAPAIVLLDEATSALGKNCDLSVDFYCSGFMFRYIYRTTNSKCIKKCL
jgi:ABC-type iron transport system FetAB ATPase subunit